MSVSAKKEPLLTSRQVAYAGVFGGLGFAWRALGLVISLFPPLMVDMRQSFLIIGASASGPYAGLAIALLCMLPSGLPLLDVVYFPVLTILWLLPYKRIYNLPSTYRYLLIWVWAFVVQFATDIIALGWGGWVLNLWPFPEYMITEWTVGVGELYAVQNALSAMLAIKFAPKFMEPLWKWRR